MFASKMVLENFELVEASKLSMDDEFMQYQPKTLEALVFKRELSEVIGRGVKNFYRPKYDPSFTEDGKGICFCAGKRPAVGKSYNWWRKVAREFDTEHGSRLGTMYEYNAFLGVLIKSLVEDGWEMEDAWSAVCKESHKLGQYLDSKDAKDDFELTGSRGVAGFFDLGNTSKLLEYKAGARWVVGGAYNRYGRHFPLSHYHSDVGAGNFCYTICVGWLVLEA